MAAVTELCFLLFALINNMHAEELIIIKEEGFSHTFELPKGSNSCLISRYVGEEKLVLWNTSDLWSENSTLPEDLKRRLSEVSRENISSYVINKLTHSDSGPYQEECWTEGKATHEKNINIIICTSKMNTLLDIPVRPGRTLALKCTRGADNQDVQWFKRDFRNERGAWTRVSGDNATSVAEHLRGRYQMVKNTSVLRIINFTTTVVTDFICLVMKRQQCVDSDSTRLRLLPETIYHSVEETAVLPCTVNDLSINQPPQWISSNTDFSASSVNQNYSLVFSSLMLNQSAYYSCQSSMGIKTYFLVVCPKFGPPAIELFSVGEKVTLRCKDLVGITKVYWFIKSNQTEGRILSLSDLSMSNVRMSPDQGLDIFNVSLKDTGEYWCAVLDIDYQCLSTTKTLVKYREPFGIHSTFYKIRCAVLSSLLVILCVAVIVVMEKTRRGE